jgi:hypothetical protein
MGKQQSTNFFVSNQSIDINKPAKVAYDPRQHQYPKMLYHPTKKDQNWLAERKRLELYNSLHPEKPEILPNVPAASIIVQSAEEEAQKIKQGWALRAPKEAEVDEFASLQGEALCSRGCGQVPHRGSCKPVQVTA